MGEIIISEQAVKMLKEMILKSLMEEMIMKEIIKKFILKIMMEGIIFKKKTIKMKI